MGATVQHTAIVAHGLVKRFGDAYAVGGHDSGVFLPIDRMPAWARWIAPLSPLSYAGDMLRGGFGQAAYFPGWLSPLVLCALTAVLFAAATAVHRRWRAKGL